MNEEATPVLTIRPDGGLEVCGREIELTSEERVQVAYLHRRMGPVKWPPEAGDDA